MPRRSEYVVMVTVVVGGGVGSTAAYGAYRGQVKAWWLPRATILSVSLLMYVHEAHLYVMYGEGLGGLCGTPMISDNGTEDPRGRLSGVITVPVVGSNWPVGLPGLLV